MTVTVADPAVHEQILDLTYPLWGEGLTRQAYGAWNRGQMSTPWGRTHLERVALVDGGQLLSSAKRYDFDAVVSACASGSWAWARFLRRPAAAGRATPASSSRRCCRRPRARVPDGRCCSPRSATHTTKAIGFRAVAALDGRR